MSRRVFRSFIYEKHLQNGKIANVSDTIEKYGKYGDWLAKFFATYGIIQVLAQDIGLPSGLNQLIMVQDPKFSFILFWASAYVISNDVIISLLSTVFYFTVKKGKKSKACFSDEV